MFTFDQLAKITNGTILANNPTGRIEHFLTDSRKTFNLETSIFIAIVGERHDGHDYIEPLYQQGVRRFIIEKEVEIPSKIREKSCILLVDQSLKALQNIAKFHREKFRYPVLAITGSNGKTIVKEWLGQLLESNFNIVKSPMSYNSQLGVPLSVLQMSDNNDLAIFEAGISTTGEMENLQKVIQPTLGIFTNIGTAHSKGFLDLEQKTYEKWMLFEGSKTVICCSDHEQVMKSKPESINTFTWGKDADISIESISKGDHRTILGLRYKGKMHEISMPFVDEASLENAMHCVATMVFMGIEMEEISRSINKLTKIEMRLELKKGVNNCYLIDDSYNNDLGGLQVAIDFLKHQPGKNRRIILSDIPQSGLDEQTLYRQLNQILVENHIKSMIGIGESMTRNAALFSIPSDFYTTTEQFLTEVNPDNFHDETILIKGARAFGFERVTNALSEKIHRTVLEINLDAMVDNLNFYRSKLQEDVKLMVMVKAAAYGNGSFEIANILEFNRVDYLAVAYPDEGVELRKQGIQLPIMVMNVTKESFDNILKYDLEPEIYSLGQLKQWIRFIENREKALKIHVKIDSGMHRLGFENEQIDELVDILRKNPKLQVVSIYSHLAGADESRHNEFTKSQVTRFLALTNRLEKALKIHVSKHILNSAGIIRFPKFQMDMVRLGIGLYGFEANQMEQNALRPISTLKTVISQIRKVKMGETVGYGRKGKATNDITIATIAIGYADGFSRAFSNGKIALSVNGKQAPIIGNICMDMSMLDVTGIDAKEGDEVIVFGANPTIKQLADAIETIPYEILTNVSSRVTRVFYSS